MPKTKQNNTTSDSDSGPDDRLPPKKAKESAKKPNDAKATDKGEKQQWTLEGMRQVRINEFRGKVMVDIREFYEKGGEVLPGKKGISLSATQWKKLLEVAEEVNEALKNH